MSKEIYQLDFARYVPVERGVRVYKKYKCMQRGRCQEFTCAFGGSLLNFD